MVRIRRFHRRGRGSIPRLGTFLFLVMMHCKIDFNTPKREPFFDERNISSDILILYSLVLPTKNIETSIHNVVVY